MATMFDIGLEYEAHDENGRHLVGLEAVSARYIFLIQSRSRRVLQVWDMQNLPSNPIVDQHYENNLVGDRTQNSNAATKEQAAAMDTSVGQSAPVSGQSAPVSGQPASEPQPTDQQI